MQTVACANGSQTPTRHDSLVALIGSVCLLALLTVGLPIFLRSPLWVDALTFDCYVKIMERGGALYQDAFEVNLPGMTWLHLLVRKTLGWSDLALRSVDFVVILSIALLATRWLASIRGKIWLVFTLLAFYLSSPEIYHCQRDFWMILPMLLAVECRLKVNERLRSGRRARLATLLEGVAWGAAIWIKPYAVVPAAAVTVFSAIWLRGKCKLSLFWENFVLLISAGLLSGLAGIVVLWASGSLSGFVEIVMHWRPIYDSQLDVLARFQRFQAWQWHFRPWSWLVHVGWFLSAVSCYRWWRRDAEATRLPLLAMFFFGWLVQALFLQHPHVYVFGSVLPIAIIVLLTRMDCVQHVTSISLAFVMFFICALVSSPILQPARTALWRQCLSESESNRLRDELTIIKGVAGQTSWQQLQPVAEFLRSKKVADGELTCFHISPQVLYLKLDVKPATRYISVNRMAVNYWSRFNIVVHELSQSRHRFVVTDLLHVPGYDMNKDSEERALVLPECFPQRSKNTFPWNQPIIFRSGRYVVHEVTRLPSSVAVHPPDRERRPG